MAELEAVFRALREVMEPFAAELERKTDTPAELYLEAKHPETGKPLFFGAVKLNKHDVSYHLMGVYTDPDLLTGTSPELRGRMQGKSCFNFRTLEPVLFGQLGELTRASLERYKQNGSSQGSFATHDTRRLL